MTDEQIVARFNQLVAEGKVEFSYCGYGEFSPLRTEDRFRLKPAAPAFVPFYVGSGVQTDDGDSWKVEMPDANTLKIGCCDFSAKLLLSAFKALLAGEVPKDYCSFIPTRALVKHPKGALTWAEVEQIVAALEKAGVK